MKSRCIRTPQVLVLALIGLACTATLESGNEESSDVVEATGGAPPAIPGSRSGGEDAGGGLTNGVGGTTGPDECLGQVCGGTCVDTTTDAEHCGGCNQPCLDEEHCVGGACQCAPGLDDCFGSCIDVTAHGEHCGACGRACGTNEACFDGNCVTDCPAHLTECSQACVDTNEDVNHCGSCGNSCPGGFSRTCSGGQCGCSDGRTLCAGQCVLTSSNNSHCGTCGNDCQGGSTCTSGQCTGGTCPVQLAGWATVSGDGVATTTGGGNASPVRPTSVQQLLNYASDSQARVIEIQGTFNAPLLDVKSNKTLIGIGNNATINGGIRIQGSNLGSRVQNVIIRNLRINARTSSDSNDNDGIQLRYAHHVWVDHCEIWDSADGNLDIVRASDHVTVSWTKFWYSSNPPDNNHRYCNLIGNGDNNEAEDSGRLRVTMHHNWWAERVHERMPRVRFGQVHVYNNYFSSSGNNYCVRAGRGARLLVENNYFHGVNRPHEFNNATDQGTAHITARDNTYNGTSGTRATGGGGTPFTNPPYGYTLDTPAVARERVQSCAGPR